MFGTCHKTVKGATFYPKRKKLAHKLGNPRLLQIGFHTFRHWKATTLYHETKDIVYVKEFLGHRNIETTMRYIQLENALFKPQDDGFTVKATSDHNEIAELLEVGFEYVCQKDTLLYFRKRK
jgi:integrase